jgi:putative salt-induced outer membrane protein YdiY
MKSCTVLVCAFVCTAWPVTAREKTDVLVMRNGDRLTCEVKGLRADVLYVSLDYALGTVSIDWFKVDHLESSQLFVVKTQNGEVYSGTLSIPKAEGGRPVSIVEVADPVGATVELPKTDVTKMDQEFQKIWQRFNGSVGLGAIYNKGNQSTQYNLSTDVDYPRERWAASANYDSTLSSSKGASASSRNQVGLSAYRLMPWNNWYYKGTANFLQSSEQGIDLQSTFAGGVGRFLKNTNHLSITLTGGLAYQRITYQQKVLVAAPENVTSAWISGQVKLFRFDRTNLIVTASLLPALSDPGRVHFNLNTSYYIKILGEFNFNVSFYGNWDTQPPTGFSGSDYGTSAGLNWTFGSR